MTDRRQSGTAGAGGSDAAEPALRSSPDLADARTSIWGGQRSRARADYGPPPGEPPSDAMPPDAMPPGAMSAAVLRAREAARLEWLHSIPDDPNERQRIADDLRP